MTFKRFQKVKEGLYSILVDSIQNINMSYVMSKRGKEHITNDGYIYRCRYIKNKVEYFTCVHGKQSDRMPSTFKCIT